MPVAMLPVDVQGRWLRVGAWQPRRPGGGEPVVRVGPGGGLLGIHAALR